MAADMQRTFPKKRLGFTKACQEWDKERRTFQQRKFEFIDGTYYSYPCAKRSHNHTVECLTQEMVDALSELAYSKE